MRYAILIIELADGRKSKHDGRWLSHYDPTKNGMSGDIRSTADPKEALAFTDMGAAAAAWQKAHGIRPDGRPNRPLTAFTVHIDKLPE